MNMRNQSNEEWNVYMQNWQSEYSAKGKGQKGFNGYCHHCGQYGHRLIECKQKRFRDEREREASQRTAQRKRLEKDGAHDPKVKTNADGNRIGGTMA